MYPEAAWMVQVIIYRAALTSLSLSRQGSTNLSSRKKQLFVHMQDHAHTLEKDMHVLMDAYYSWPLWFKY